MAKRMKFIIKSVKDGGCRLGVLSDFGNHGNKTLETPFCMLYTRRGSAPHLTADVLKKVQGRPTVAHIPMTMLAEYEEALSEYKEGIAKFSNMQDYLVYSSVHDPAMDVPQGYNKKSAVAVWTKSGKIEVDVDDFIKIQEAFLPDFYQSLSDGDTDLQTGRKRTVKSVDRTLTYLDQILEKSSKSQVLKDTPVFGVIEGAGCIQERCRSAKETATRPVSGFVLEGFYKSGPNSLDMDLTDFREILTKTLACLPDDKPRVMQSAFNPEQILSCIEMGLDIFDSSYPYIVTERGSALVFNFKYKDDPEDGDSKCTAKGFEINLNDKKYFDDFGPILKGCSCYTCTNFTRAYVNHLLNTSELLASVLLMIHNFQHYFQFFEAIRCALIEDKFAKLKSLIISQKAPSCS